MVVTAPVKVRLRIPLKLPYKNELTPSYGNRAFFCFKAMQREWNAAIPNPEPHQVALGARRLTIVRLMAGRERPFDTGNVYYAAAAIIDIVAKKGWLVDDTPELLELEKPVQRMADLGEDAPSTYIEIEDLPGAAVKTARLPGV
jgi:hypothetical protein